MKLTYEQLAEIRQRTENASAGPWELGEECRELWNRDGRNFLGGMSLYDYDATFIANARTDIPALLDMITELQSIIEGTVGAIDELDVNYLGYCSLRIDDITSIRNKLTEAIANERS